MIQCDNCNSTVQIVAKSIVNHKGLDYDGANGTYKLKIHAECECLTEQPMMTELDSIEFSGNPPEGWQ